MDAKVLLSRLKLFKRAPLGKLSALLTCLAATSAKTRQLRLVGKPLDYLSESALRWTAGITLVLWTIVATDTFARHINQWEPPVMLVIAVGLLILIFSFRSRQFEAVAIVFLVAQVVLIGLLVRSVGDLSLGHLFVLAVTTGGAFLGPLGVLFVGLLAVLFQLAGYWDLSGLVGTIPVLGTLITTFLAIVVNLISSMAMLSALDVVRRMSVESRQQVLELRERQGELNRTIKALTLAEDGLARANIELRRAKEFAEEAKRFKTELASRVSHELRTPLNLIIGFSETMVFSPESYGRPLPAAYRRDLAEIHSASRHLMGLITDILDLAKLQSGRLGLLTEPVDIRDILTEAEQMLKGLADRKGLWLRHIYETDTLVVLADRMRVRQVLLNLVSNAIRLTSHGGVTVRVARAQDQIVVEVTDTGPGIPEDQLDRVFEEFRQVEDSRVRHQQGLGLGLSISREIVKMHGGRIWVRSRVGEGSTFGFSLPCAGALPYAGLIALGHAGVRPRDLPAVIVVDREGQRISEFLRRHLEGFVVLEASDWTQLPDLVQREGARAILAATEDIPSYLPEGLQVPVIGCPLGRSFLSNMPGVNAIVEKPITIEKVRECFERFDLAGRRVLLMTQSLATGRMLTRMLSACDATCEVIRLRTLEQLAQHTASNQVALLVLDCDTLADHHLFEIIAAVRSEYRPSDLPIAVFAWEDDDAYRAVREVRLIQPVGSAVDDSLHYVNALLHALDERGSVQRESADRSAS